MNPQSPCGHNPQCPASGQRGQGNMRVHSQAEPRDRGRTCGPTLVATRGTPCYRLHTAVDLVPIVLTLLCHGCPLHAMVAAFGLDERTVAPRLLPALAAGLTHQRWSMFERRRSQVPVPAWVAPKRRGRPPKQADHLVMAVAA